MKGHLIGLTGRAQHGKDSTGRILVEEYGFKRYAFADTLKSMALALDPFIDTSEGAGLAPFTRLTSMVNMFGWEQAKQYPECRRFLQVLGTEAVRDHLGEDAWVEALERSMVEAGDWGKQDLVVTDVRFPNEFDWVKSVGGTVWRVKRLQGAGTKVYDNGLGDNHPSEAWVDKFVVDRELRAWNLEMLENEVHAAMEDLDG